MPSQADQLTSQDRDFALLYNEIHGAPGVPAISVNGIAASGGKPWFDVTHPAFGAKGDGTTDDAIAIRAAIAAANALPNGAVVFLPPGNYKVTQRLPPGIGVSIVGAGRNVSKITSTMTNDIVILGAGNNSGAVYRDFSLQLPAASACPAPTGLTNTADYLAASPAGFAIGLSPGQFAGGCQVSCVTVDGGTIGMLLGYDRGTVIMNCRVANPRSYALNISGGQSSGTDNVFSTVSVYGSLFQVANASGTAATTEFPANVRISPSASFSPAGVSFYGCLFDEVGLNSAGGGASVHVSAGRDILFSGCGIYVPGKKQGGGAAYYGVRIGPTCQRVSLHRVRLEPYTHDVVRVPDQTIYIESGAVNVTLQDVTTDANGGGDISDAGTNTNYLGVNGTIRRTKQAPAFSATPTPDPTLGEIYAMDALTGGVTVGPPSNGATGQHLRFYWTQDGTGNRTVTYNAVYKTGGFSAPAKTASTVTIDDFECIDGTVWRLVSRAADQA